MLRLAHFDGGAVVADNNINLNIVFVDADKLRKMLREEIALALATERAALAATRKPSLLSRIWRMWGAF